MMVIINIILAVVGAILCYNIAKKKNRNTIGWTIFGLFLPIIAIVCVYLIKPKPIEPIKPIEQEEEI